jgi:hypothetical protein
MKTTTQSQYLRLSLSALVACFVLSGCSDGEVKQRTRAPLAEGKDDADAKKKTRKDKEETSKGTKDGGDAAQADGAVPGTAPVGNPAGDPAGVPAGEPAGEPAADPAGEPAEEPAPGEPKKEVARLKASVGIKNFAQINATMSTLTTIPTTNAVVQPVYAQLATQLPDGNDIRAFLASHQVAIGKLAVEYCDAMVNTPAAANVVLPGIALNVAPATALNATGREAINKALITRFWGTGMSGVPEMGESLATLSKLTDELLAGKNMNTAARTPSVVKGLCTAVLSSGPVTFQ